MPDLVGATDFAERGEVFERALAAKLARILAAVFDGCCKHPNRSSRTRSIHGSIRDSIHSNIHDSIDGSIHSIHGSIHSIHGSIHHIRGSVFIAFIVFMVEKQQ